MQTAQIIPFQFEAREVRTLLIDDQLWFVAADVAASLQYRMASDMTRGLDDDERGTQIVRTPSGDQEMLVINESGLYSAILRSRKPEAKRFKKWVTAEVLPAIRKHGRYDDAAGRMQTLLGATIGTDGFRCLAAVVDGKVRALPAPVRRRAKAKLWAQVHGAFSVGRAEDIPAEQLDAARNFVAAYALEGEWLPKVSQGDFVISQRDALDICHLLHHAEWCVHRWNQDISKGVMALNQPLWSRTHEHFQEVERVGRGLERSMSEIIGHFRSRLGGLRPGEREERRLTT